MRGILFLFLLVVSSAKGANIYVIDGGLEPAYIPQLGRSLLRESCYSLNGDSRRYRTTDSLNRSQRGFYEYRYASLCQNKKAEQHGNSGSEVSTLRSDGLLGALGKNGFPDENISVVTDQHQTVVAGIIKNHTSSGVRQWHIHNESLLGNSDSSGEIVYTVYNQLNQSGRTVHTVSALKDIAEGSLGLNGVKVISMSQIVPQNSSLNISDRYTWPCDNHPDVTRAGILKEYAKHIRTLRNRGVIFVTGTANSVIYPSNSGNLVKDNDKIPFPACLSTTVAVGGLSSFGVAQGALGPGIDFVENFHATNPLTTGSVSGTSYATPKVASYLVELQTVNPVLNSNQVLNALRNTGSVHCGSRNYGTVRKDYCIVRPQFNSARDSIIDSFWKDLVSLFQGSQDNRKYGWEYGTGRHENGVLSYFQTINVNPKQLNTDQNIQASSQSQSVVKYSFKPFDIDTNDEVQILVNDKHYGFLKTTGSNTLGARQYICISQSDLKSDGSNNEVKLKLKNSREKWGVTALKIEAGVMDSSCLRKPITYPELPPNADRLTGSSVARGIAYQQPKVSEVDFDFNVDRLFPTPTTYAGKKIRRDIVIRFTARSGETSGTSNGTEVWVNNVNRHTTSSFHGNNERSYQIIVSRNHLINGNNTVQFRPKDNTSNSVWGIRNVSIEYIKPIDLTVGVNDANSYGSNQSPKRMTGARFNVSLPTVLNDYSFQVQGWDIDSSNEVQVFLNGESQGFLSSASNQSYNLGNTFKLPRAKLKTGVNQIELVQKSGSDQWAVRNTMVSVLKPDLVPSDVDIVDSQLEVNQPFDVTILVSNLGEGSSHNTVAHYYISTDKVIDRGDTLIHSASLGSINSESSVSQNVTIQSSLVNQGYYFGVCVDGVANELNTNNNCSQAIRFQSDANVAPIINLLLND